MFSVSLYLKIRVAGLQLTLNRVFPDPFACLALDKLKGLISALEGLGGYVAQLGLRWPIMCA